MYLKLLGLLVPGSIAWFGFRALFLDYIDASASLNSGPASSVFGSTYTATVDVHIGHPANVECEVEAVDETGAVAGSDSFTLSQADGAEHHVGTLTVTQEVDVNEKLDITCSEVES